MDDAIFTGRKCDESVHDLERAQPDNLEQPVSLEGRDVWLHNIQPTPGKFRLGRWSFSLPQQTSLLPGIDIVLFPLIFSLLSLASAMPWEDPLLAC